MVAEVTARTVALRGLSISSATSPKYRPGPISTSFWVTPPVSRSTSMTLRASPNVRTNGIITHTLVSPMSSRTCRSASHSIAKQSANSGDR